MSAAWWRGQLPMLSDFESKLLVSFFPGWTDGTSRPSYINSGGAGGDDNTGTVTLLAILAHEFGHVLWYDTMDPNRDPDYVVNNSWCPGLGFFTAGWIDPPAKPPMWREFAGSHPANAASGSPFPDLLREIGQGQWSNAQGNLKNVVYGDSRGYPSLFGAYSPDEDFIETFVFAVLLRAEHPLRNLKLRIPNGPFAGDTDIPARAGRGILQRKIACFQVTG